MGALLSTFPKDPDETVEALVRGRALGINLFAVPGGPRRMRREKLLGQALRQMSPHGRSITVIADVEASPTTTTDDVMRRIETLQSRFDMEKIPVVAVRGIRDIESLKAASGPGRSLECLLRLRHKGVIQGLQMTAYEPFDEAAAIAGFGLFNAVCLRYNLASGADAIALMQQVAEHGLGLVTRGALGEQGGDRLRPSGGAAARRPAYPPPGELICYNAVHPWVSSVLIELHSSAEVEELVEMAEGVGLPSAAEVAKRRMRLGGALSLH